MHANRWFNVVICLLFCGFTLSGVEFPHPLSERPVRKISVAFLVAWLGSMVWLAIVQHVIDWLRVTLMVAPMWTVLQVARRLVSKRGSHAIATETSH